MPPSSNLTVSIRAVTVGGLIGKPNETDVETENEVSFGGYITPIAGNDLTVDILIPEVENDVRQSVMLIVVSGPKRCDFVNDHVDLDLPQLPLHSKTWIVAVLEVTNFVFKIFSKI